MKVLFYNWVDYSDELNRGGGVTHYLRNVLHQMDARDDVACTFLSSGISYDLRSRPPRWSRVVHGAAKGRERRFEIVNSGCLSPSHHSFGHPAQVSDPDTEAVFADFLQSVGPFDVVHFNNLEGLPATVLDLKAQMPGTRFILSLHNYYPFCPQVNFWHREEAHCDDFANGERCVGCLPYKPNPRMVRLANSANFSLQKRGVGPGTVVYDRGAGPAMRMGVRTLRKIASARRSAAVQPTPPPVSAPVIAEPIDPSDAGGFRDRRDQFVELINRNCDTVLCVSDRVAEIARRHGVSDAKLRTSYIGSDHAVHFDQTRPKSAILRPDGTAQMAFLGYMRRDKGFFFLLEALETLDPTLASRLHLVFAAAGRDPLALAAFDRLRPRFASLTWHDGYRRHEMDRMLSEVDFGIVPVLWEDNLPQVAIEMHSRHIPLLTSHRGGASELGRCPGMVFRAGDIDDLHRRLAQILNGDVDLEGYWAGAMPPVSMDQHLADLLDVFGGQPPDPEAE